jgi:hypothetical protein
MANVKSSPSHSYFLLAALITFGLLSCTLLIGIEVQSGVFQTLLLAYAALLFGLKIISSSFTEESYGRLSTQLQKLWIIKIVFTLILVSYCWAPELLNESLQGWGTDQQRFYSYSVQLIEQNWDTTGIVQNYQGVIWFYAAIIWIFNKNPVAPALVNCLLTLFATLVIIKYLQCLMLRGKDYKLLGFLLVVPEVIWYDVLTGRETIVGAAIILANYYLLSILRNAKNDLMINSFLILFFSVMIILTVRTSMILPLLATFFLIFYTSLRSNKSSTLTKSILFLIIIAITFTGGEIQQMLGGYATNYLELISSLQSLDMNVAQDADWSSNSVGIRLTPEGLIDSIYLSPLRLLAYLISPLPNIGFDFVSLANGSWFAWQSFLVSSTSVMMVLSLPLVVAGTELAVRLRKSHRELFVLVLLLWVNLVAISFGNFIIHERYRVMITIPFFACAWVGFFFSKPHKIRIYFKIWMAVLIAGATTYIVLKLN